MSTTKRVTDERLVYISSTERAVHPLDALVESAIEPGAEQAGLIAVAALVQHVDQERIATALENIAEQLHDMVNAITSYEGR